MTRVSSALGSSVKFGYTECSELGCAEIKKRIETIVLSTNRISA